MANNITGNPWSLDTAAAVTTETMRVKRSRWVAPAAAGADELIIHDSAGRVVHKAVASGANFQDDQLVETSGPDDWKGVTVNTIDSGTAFIYYY